MNKIEKFETFDDPNILLDIGNLLNDCRISDKFTDFTLKSSEGKILKVHKAILWSTCPYFKALFSSNLKESSENFIHFKDDFIKLDLDIIIEYLYTGLARIPQNRCKIIFEKANYFQLTALQNFCAKLLTKEIDPENWLNMFRYSRLYYDDVLTSGCVKYVANRIYILLDHHLIELTLEELEIIISNKELVNYPEKSFTIIVHWVKLDLAKRNAHMENLLANINLTEISEEFLTSAVKSDDVLRQSKIFSYNLLHLVAKSFRRMKLLNKSCPANITVVIDREASSVPIAHGMNLVNHVLNSNEMDAMPMYPIGRSPPIVEQGPLRPPMEMEQVPSNQRRNRHHRQNNSVKTTSPGPSGYRRQRHSRYLRRLSTASRISARSNRIQPSTSQENSAQLENDDSHIFIVNQFNIGKLNMEQKKWKRQIKFKSEKFQYAVASDERNIFLTGGLSTKSHSSSIVNCYIPETNRIIRIPSMIEGRRNHRSIFCNGQIYSVGGEGCQGSVEYYDIGREIWSRAASMQRSRSFFGLASNGTCIYAAGGALVHTIERFDPREGEWSQIAHIPRRSYRCKSVCNNNMLYCIDPSSSGFGYDLRTNKLREEIYPEIEIEEGGSVWNRYDVVQYNGDIYGVFHNQLYQYDEFVWTNLNTYLKNNIESVNLCSM